MRCASWAVEIDYLGVPGFPPLRIGRPQLKLDAADPGARRRVQPVPHRAADGAAAGRRQPATS